MTKAIRRVAHHAFPFGEKEAKEGPLPNPFGKKKAEAGSPGNGIHATYEGGTLTVSRSTLEGITRHTIDFKTGERDTRYEPFAQPEGITGFPVMRNAEMRLQPHEVDFILDSMRKQLGNRDYKKLEAHLRSIQAD